jgi:hypothetical protein
MAGVEQRDAGVAGGLVTSHTTSAALGLGVLVTAFDAAGSATDGPRALLAERVPPPACSWLSRSP